MDERQRDLVKAFNERSARNREPMTVALLILMAVAVVVAGWLFLHDPAGLMK